MKKCLLVGFMAVVFIQMTVAQAHHGVKLDGNFASVASDQDYGTELKSVMVPGFSYSFLYMGDNWGFIMESGYVQSGFKEVYPEGTTLTCKIHHWDVLTLGVQYAFLTDWYKVRPILQGRLGFRMALAGNVSSGDEGADIDYGVLDAPFSINGGVMIDNHWTLTLGYGHGLANYLYDISGSRYQNVQFSATYYF